MRYLIILGITLSLCTFSSQCIMFKNDSIITNNGNVINLENLSLISHQFKTLRNTYLLTTSCIVAYLLYQHYKAEVDTYLVTLKQKISSR